MTLIDLNLIDPHPGNANRMTPELLAKLVAHIQATGRYPALIVRPMANERFQMLDGHHRLEALRRLGHAQACCDIWPVDDEQATILLLTLNRLHGEDDADRRGALLRQLTATMDVDALFRILPENRQRLEQLLALADPPPEPREPTPVDDMPHAVTFFLAGPQRRALLARLRELYDDRNIALVMALQLDQAEIHHRAHADHREGALK